MDFKVVERIILNVEFSYDDNKTTFLLVINLSRIFAIFDLIFRCGSRQSSQLLAVMFQREKKRRKLSKRNQEWRKSLKHGMTMYGKIEYTVFYLLVCQWNSFSWCTITRNNARNNKKKTQTVFGTCNRWHAIVSNNFQFFFNSLSNKIVSVINCCNFSRIRKAQKTVNK